MKLLRFSLSSLHGLLLGSLLTVLFGAFTLSSCSEDPAEIDTPTITSISISHSPDKVSYYDGDSLDLSGLVLSLLYSDNSRRSVSLSKFKSEGIVVNPSDGSILDGSVSSVSITHPLSGSSVFEIITTDGIEITGLEIKSAPRNTFYDVGDVLSLDGLAVSVSYNNGVVSDVPFVDFSDADLSVSVSDGAVLSAEDVVVVVQSSNDTVSISQNLVIFSRFTDIRDGKAYKTVKIGDQIWMAENLAYVSTDGSMSYVTSNDAWSKLNYDDQAYCYYNNDSALGYGCLYTWSAAMDGYSLSPSNSSVIQGICPDGWYLPSYDDWCELEDYLCDNGYNWNGSTTPIDSDLTIYNKIAKSIASRTGWSSARYSSEIGCNPASNNSSGLSILPGGYRHGSGGTFSNKGERAGLWSSCLFGTSNEVAGGLKMYSDLSALIIYHCHKTEGHSVRCIKN